MQTDPILYREGQDIVGSHTAPTCFHNSSSKKSSSELGSKNVHSYPRKAGFTTKSIGEDRIRCLKFSNVTRG